MSKDHNGHKCMPVPVSIQQWVSSLDIMYSALCSCIYKITFLLWIKPTKQKTVDIPRCMVVGQDWTCTRQQVVNFENIIPHPEEFIDDVDNIIPLSE